MSSILYNLGLGPSPTGIEPPAHPAAIILTNFALSYLLTSTRAIKVLHNFDHNVSPREDTTKYGPALVKAGKITQKQLDRIKRQEAAHANSTEHFPFLFGSVLFMLLARLPASTVNLVGAVYTLARVGFAVAYVLVERQRWSWVRTGFWWVSNVCCITAVVKSANALA